MLVKHHKLPNIIMSNWGLVFILKFLLLLYCFLKIKQKLSIIFHSQIDSLDKSQNRMIDPLLRVFINYEQNNFKLARLFLMAEIAYNNTKNLSNSYTLFKLNYHYYSHLFYKKNIHPRCKLKLADELSTNL